MYGSSNILESNVFRLTIEQLQTSVFITDPRGVIEYVNPYFEKKTGYANEEVIGKTPSVINSGEHPPEFYQKLWNTILHGDTWQGEILNKKKCGEVYWCEVTISPITDVQGKISHYVAIEHDISAQKKALYTATRRENLLNDIQYLSETGGWHYDVREQEIYWTDELYKIHGLKKGKADDLITQSLSCYHPDDRVKVSAAFRKLLADGTPYDLTMRITDMKGNQKWIRTTTRAVFDDEGGVDRAYGSVMDVTKEVATKESLYSSYRERGILLSEIHHRVKNNLAMISGLLQLQVMGIDDESKRAVLNKSIYRINAISLIHEQLYQSDNFSEISLAGSIRIQAEEMYRIYDVPADIRFNFDLHDVVVSINQAQPVGLLVHEILSNCFTYAFDGRQSGNITVRLRAVNDHILLDIKDDGVGSDLETLTSGRSLGSLLIKNLLLQLEAECSVSAEQGVGYSIRFRKEQSAQSFSRSSDKKQRFSSVSRMQAG